MSFDTKGFMSVAFERRQQDFKVPQLKDWFEKGSKAVWKIQSLSGAEIGKADEAAGNETLTGQLFNSMMSANSPEVVAKVKELVGRSTDKPKQIARRIYHLQYGAVDPACTLEMAVRICDHYPILFLDITNAILTLSGQGSVAPGKSKPSGTTKK